MSDYSEWMRDDLITKINRLERKLDEANARAEKAEAEAAELRTALAAANEYAEYLSRAAAVLMQKWGSDELTMIDFARISAVIECRRARVGGGK